MGLRAPISPPLGTRTQPGAQTWHLPQSPQPARTYPGWRIPGLHATITANTDRHLKRAASLPEPRCTKKIEFADTWLQKMPRSTMHFMIRRSHARCDRPGFQRQPRRSGRQISRQALCRHAQCADTARFCMPTAVSRNACIASLCNLLANSRFFLTGSCPDPATAAPVSAARLSEASDRLNGFCKATNSPAKTALSTQRSQFGSAA